ncbi:transcriptional regulator, MarR family [Corynebacterium sp. CMW7794]|uniref:MarR family transcriptional regulator n=1 Tax=Corynebacterium phoceense TaxID=1686286 RepID=A0A540R965_9CORY|nr:MULTISPECIES: MarR family transcriptional regulator [Corynebacterium]KXB52605.1 transcriptional regulator, MarR family [Corynebacterium sp. DNF00584]KXI17831.1 transcriptional regulator, MarR family [Corynebacterium sp. CMW7794]MBF9012034.1 MarR family transcriptional regulator [Corynebacterium phoceense]OFL79254.1 transcriptional regulator [Corynebacterium sp. HMSC077B05]OFN43025.1 transcriptional regulator [Corynebacterium sp. HMSC072G08]
MNEQDAESPSSFEVALEVSTELQPALNKLMVIFQRTTEGSRLTTSQVSIMNQLKRRGPSRVSAIAEAELIRMPTASNALYQLESRGFVERMRDEKDRRGVLVALTELGEAELNTVSRQRAEALAEILRWLEPEDLETANEFTGLISRLATVYQPPRFSQNG